MTIRVREFGAGDDTVIVRHGGPAAVGHAAPLARGLADEFRVLEPWQRGSGPEPLTVATHIADLHDVIAKHCSGRRPALVGESWGAMLALAYAAAHSEVAGCIALIGCGTFDTASRARFKTLLEDRMTDAARTRIAELERTIFDPAELLRLKYEQVIRPIYDVNPLPDPVDDPEAASAPWDPQAHCQAWDDMMRLQETGVYPAAFSAVRLPVLMLHGDRDPHPGSMIRDNLKCFLPQIEYIELHDCGHSPWRERAARDEFFSQLRAWLRRHGQMPSAGGSTSDALS